MALRDTWHRTLVYFGLARGGGPALRGDPGAEPEAELEDRYASAPTCAAIQRRRADEFDDIFPDEPRSGARDAGAASRRRQRPRRPGGEIRFTCDPEELHDAQQVADQFKEAIP
jgi:cell division inhibitor SepF